MLKKKKFGTKQFLTVICLLIKLQFSKIYDDIKEEAHRRMIYLDNKLKIARHNKLYESGEETYALEMNHFGDMVSILTVI